MCSAKKIFPFILLLLAVWSCDDAKKTSETALKPGIWRAEILQQGDYIPFNFEVAINEGDTIIYLLNDTERLMIDDISVRNDSIVIPMHIFDIEIAAVVRGDSLVGNYHKLYANDFFLPFRAAFGQNHRFRKNDTPASQNLAGKWSINFITRSGANYPAIGEFRQEGKKVFGTFLTELGDYRFIEGQINGDQLEMSAFDGNHLFLFRAEIAGDSIRSGVFMNGKYTLEKWEGYRNPNAQLSDPESLTFLKDGYDKIAFSFPDMDGNQVSLADENYQNKVVILQIFGTWCPNCMDESKFLALWHQKHQQEDVEIIGLSYEVKDDFAYAAKRLKMVKEKLGINYDMLVAGVADKTKAAATLPMLNHILSFPTTIFIDKKGDIRRIHTGFSGPGTGVHYEDFVTEFEGFMEELLAE